MYKENMRNIVGVLGVPGTGKSTLMRKFLSNYKWEVVTPVPLLNSLYSKELDLYVFGKYEDGEVFPGTDKLSMAVQPVAQVFIKNSSSNILFEGDRLTSQKFFNFLLELPESYVTLMILKTNQKTLNARYVERGSNQSETFLKGRETKISNVESNMDYWDVTKTFPNNNLDDQANIIIQLEIALGI